MTTTTATEIGRAIARDTLADDLDREWAGLDPQDADRLPEDCDLDDAERIARETYEQVMLVASATQVCRYDDADRLAGVLDLTTGQALDLHAAAQWPEGLVSLGELRSIAGDRTLGGDAADDVTVYVE